SCSARAFRTADPACRFPRRRRWFCPSCRSRLFRSGLSAGSGCSSLSPPFDTQFALPEYRLRPGDVLANLADSGRIFQLPGRLLEAKVEQFLLQRTPLVFNFRGGQFGELLSFHPPHHPLSPVRRTSS